jgi:exonuclease SbcD
MHISDLHIGKRVYEFSMLEDQKYILNQILAILDEERPDGVLIAGDVYDKTVPSAEAVQVLDRFLTGIGERRIPVMLISGNHDSPERLAFGAELMKGQGIHISPVYDGTVQKVSLTDAYGEVHIYLLPFLKPQSVRHALTRERETALQAGEEERAAALEKEIAGIVSANDAVRFAVSRMQVDPAARNVLMAHQFVTGARSCDSEEVQAGGLDQVQMEIFDDFDYVALGHIHSPQKVRRETVRYCGTPLKYSFSEAGQQKSVTMVELKEKGNLTLRELPLKPLRDMRKVKGTYLEVTAKSFYEGTNTRDYLQVTLTDEEDVPDGLAKLQILYPNLMNLQYDNRRTRENQEILADESGERKSELEFFEEFYELQNNQSMSEAQRKFCMELIEKIKGREDRL